MKNNKIKIILKYFDETIESSKIDNYKDFLNFCYKQFEMSKEEISSLKIFKLDEPDEITIENEDDFKSNLESDDNNQIIYILKSKGRKKKNNNILNNSQHYPSKNILNQNQQNKMNISNQNQQNKMNISNQNQQNKTNISNQNQQNKNNHNSNFFFSNQKKDDGIKVIAKENSPISENSELHNIIETMKSENEKLKKDMLNEINKEFELKYKKSFKKSITDIKTFLVGMDESMKNNQESIKEMSMHNSRLNNSNEDYYLNLLEDIKKEYNKQLKSNFEKTLNLEKQIKDVNENIKKMSNQFKNLTESMNKQIKAIEEIKKLQNENLNMNKQLKKEENQFYGCIFIDENYTINNSYDEIQQKSNFNFQITLLNNGNLSWPKNSFIYGKSFNNLIEIKSIINNREEILPNQKSTITITLNLNKIKNENIQISFPLKLAFPNKKNVNIIQNEFILNLIIKESKKEEKKIIPKENIIDDNKPIIRSQIYNTPGNNEFNLLKNENEKQAYLNKNDVIKQNIISNENFEEKKKDNAYSSYQQVINQDTSNHNSQNSKINQNENVFRRYNKNDNNKINENQKFQLYKGLRNENDEKQILGKNQKIDNNQYNRLNKENQRINPTEKNKEFLKNPNTEIDKNDKKNNNYDKIYDENILNYNTNEEIKKKITMNKKNNNNKNYTIHYNNNIINNNNNNINNNNNNIKNNNNKNNNNNNNNNDNNNNNNDNDNDNDN